MGTTRTRSRYCNSQATTFSPTCTSRNKLFPIRTSYSLSAIYNFATLAPSNLYISEASFDNLVILFGGNGQLCPTIHSQLTDRCRFKIYSQILRPTVKKIFSSKTSPQSNVEFKNDCSSICLFISTNSWCNLGFDLPEAVPSVLKNVGTEMSFIESGKFSNHNPHGR